MPIDRIIIPFGQSAAAIGGVYDIFGTNTGTETVTVFDGTIANFMGDFARGGDVIKLTGAATDFTIRIAGSNVQLISVSDGITAVIPIGIAGATVQFEDSIGGFGDVRTLIYDGTNVLLGGQIVTSTATAVDAAPSPSAFAPESALDTPIFTAFDESGPTVVDATTAHSEGALFSQGAADSGMTNFVFNFA